MENNQIGGVKTPGGVFITLMKQEFPDIVNVRQIKKKTEQETKIVKMMSSCTL